MEANHTSGNDIPLSTELQISHRGQRFYWDCGVSCILMVLPPKKCEDFLENFNEVCNEEDFHESTWTIDLCYLLLRYSVQHQFCTVTLGVHPGYHSQSFYAKVLQKDKDRVVRRFAEASSKGIVIRQASLTVHELMQHLAYAGPIILLTNARLLTCDVCKGNKLTAELRSCLPWSVTYTGHYILLCGYNLPKQKFYYRNPAYKNRVCCMSFVALNEARLSYGTDEDAILIYSNNDV